jgi:hypothetical protein
MRINNNNSLDLAAKKAESLTLLLLDGDAQVTFSGLTNGSLSKGTPHHFTMPMTGTDLALLVRVNFKDKTGGFASIRVSDANGTVAPFTFTQFPNVVTNAVVFLIDIE